MKIPKLTKLTAIGLMFLSPWCISAQESKTLGAENIRSVMKKVADWQIAAIPGKGQKHKEHDSYSWTMGALFVGMSAWSDIAGDEKVVNYLKARCDSNQWKLGPRALHADDHCVGDVYLHFYAKDKNPKLIEALKAQFDRHLQNPPTSELNFKSKGNDQRWSWCDALFMSPPVWAQLSEATGDLKYIDYMDKEWWLTTEYLYDKEEHLFFRDSRYFGKVESNGKKVFWGRGNGWVFAGIPRVLDSMPKDYPARTKYEQLFKDMATKIGSLQQSDGLWRASLLNPDKYPVKETSASGFYCYGLAWGIHKGLLDRETYLPKVIKAWEALVGCVHSDGMLGNVQPIGEAPESVTRDMTEVYGVGAFLMAGTEILKLDVISK